jgi:MFS family permease
MTVPRHRTSQGFPAALCSLIAVFAAGATPLPLFDEYRREGVVATNQLALLSVSYFVAAVATLLVLGRLSTYVGRRAVAVSALVLAAGGCAVLLDVHSVMPLLVGRALLGVATGLATSAVASYVVDTSPQRPAWLGSAAAGTAPMVGITIGALGSGALTELGPTPGQVPYLMALALLSGCIIAVLMAPETVERTRGALASLKPHLHVPVDVRPLMPVAGWLYISTWSLGGFYHSFIPSIASDYLGTNNTFVAAVILTAFLAPSVVAGPVVGALRPVLGQRLGITIFVIGVAGIITALSIGSALAFIIASVVAGLGQGCVFAATLRLLLSKTRACERAGLFSVLYAISYTGAAFTSLVAGQAVGMLGIFNLALGYGALALVACFVTLIATRRDGMR